MTYWCAINTKPHQEKRAELHLNRLSVETFLPLFRQSKMIRRTRKTVVSPFFPGYLFARFDLKEQYRAVTYARGVHKIVEFGSRPAIVDGVLIDAIKGKLSNGYVTFEPKRWVHGQAVQIQDGLLCGLDAVFLREMPGQQRILLLLRELGYQARAVVDAEHVDIWPTSKGDEVSEWSARTWGTFSACAKYSETKFLVSEGSPQGTDVIAHFLHRSNMSKPNQGSATHEGESL